MCWSIRIDQGGVSIGSGIIAHSCSNLSGKWCHERGEPIAKLVTDEPVEFEKQLVEVGRLQENYRSF